MDRLTALVEVGLGDKNTEIHSIHADSTPTEFFFFVLRTSPSRVPITEHNREITVISNKVSSLR